MTMTVVDSSAAASSPSMTTMKVAAHPTAQALFAAFEQRDSSSSSSSNSDTTTTTTTTACTTKKQSNWIQRKTHSLGWRSRHSQSDRYPITVQGHTFAVTQVQRGEVEGTYGTGATVWPASVVLIKYLEKNASVVLTDKTVVELGAGTGVASIAAAYLGASRVVCTDGVDSVVRLAADNVRNVDSDVVDNDNETMDKSNRLPIPIKTSKYMWGQGGIGNDKVGSNGDVVDDDGGGGGSSSETTPTTPTTTTGTFDVVLVSDCVLPKLYPIAPLVDGLQELMGPESVAIVSYEHRHYPLYHPGDYFRKLCEEAGFVIREIGPDEQDDRYIVDDILLWEIKRC